jgi:sugar lactone lactonase YvrE
MATTSFTAPRRYVGFAFVFALLLFSFCISGEAVGQGVTPPVIVSSPSELTYPSGIGGVLQSAVDMYGNWLFVDWVNGSLFEVPAGSTTAITLGKNILSGSGSYQNPSILIDPGNNLYLGGNWNNCLTFFPWDAAKNTWDGLSSLSKSNNASALCSLSAGAGSTATGFNFMEGSSYMPAGSGFWGFQPWSIAVGNNNNLIIGSQSPGNFIISVPITGGWSNPVASTNTTLIIQGMTKRPNSVAQDPAGNVFFVEDSGGLSGLYEVPAGATGLASDADPRVTRVDPNLPSVKGVILDAAGNLYVSDSSNGVFFIPNPSGMPQTSAAVQISSVSAQGEVAIDWARNILYVPTYAGSGPDFQRVTRGFAEFGSSPVGTATTTATNVAFNFTSAVTPSTFTIVESGVSPPDFSISGGTCVPNKAVTVGSSCTEAVTMTPTAVSSVSAQLLMLDSKSNVLGSIILHGTGTGAISQLSPALESKIGTGLKTPSQVTTDDLGNVYVADPGQGKVLMYAAGSSASSTPVSIGTGLKAPTGVAVDGVGDVFIADSGNVYEVPFGLSGLNAKGQATLVNGLGSNLNLAVNSLGDLYVADPTNMRVVVLSDIGGSDLSVFAGTIKLLTAGLTAPSAVAVDASNNLYVIDDANLFEFTAGAGSPAALLTSLSGATGLAVDLSGAVYLTSGAVTERIPLVSGALSTASETALAADVASASSVALDRAGNVYLVSTAGGSITTVSTSGTLNFGNVALGSTPTLPVILTNAGNAALTVSGYSSTNTVDYYASDVSCTVSAVAAGSTCSFDVNMVPGPGEQGTLTGVIGVTSNSVNAPVVDATGVSAALKVSTSNIVAGSPTQVISTPITVTVAPPAGTTTTPTGTVTVSYPSFTAPGGVLTQVTSTVSATLSGGTAQFTLSPVSAGTQTITVKYSGDRVFGRSTGTLSVNVAKSNIIALGLDPKAPSYLPFTLQSNGYTPYDGSQNYWEYQMPVTITTAAGLATGTITYNDDSSVCPPGTSATGQGAAACLLNGNKGVACASTGSTGVQNLTPTAVANTTGTAFNTSCLQISTANSSFKPIFGTHYITPVYSGDANFNGVTGTVSTLFQVVQSPAVVITSSTPSLTITAGTSRSAPLALNSVLGYGFAGQGGTLNNYTFPLTLTCDNLPPHAQCGFTYPNPDPNIANALDIACTGTKGNGATASCATAIAGVTIYTNVSSGITISRNAGISTLTLASIYGLGMIGLFFRRKAFQKGGRMMMVLLTMVSGALAISLSACSTTNLTPVSSTATPAGTYTVQVTAIETGVEQILNAGVEQPVYGNQNQVSLPFYVTVTVQ